MWRTEINIDEKGIVRQGGYLQGLLLLCVQRSLSNAKCGITQHSQVVCQRIFCSGSQAFLSRL
jgi:hypothetical protein